MSNSRQINTFHTEVCSTIEVPETLAAKSSWTTSEFQSVVKLNYDKLTPAQLSQLDTETAEMNEDLETSYTAMEIFETIVSDTAEMQL